MPIKNHDHILTIRHIFKSVYYFDFTFFITFEK